MSSKAKALLRTRQADFGADVKPEDDRAPLVNTPANLRHACVRGNRSAALRAIQEGAIVDDPGVDGWLPLHMAVAHGHEGIARMLLTKGAWVNAPSSTASCCRGATVLHLATGRGDAAMVRMLLKRGAKPDLRDDAGFCPLHMAACLSTLR